MIMPDSTGALTPSDNDKIQNWWNQHWKAPVTCPVCKTTEWTVAPHVVNIQRHAIDAAVANTVSYPHIVVTCKSCAHSMFFNAVQIGISASRPVPSFTNALTNPNPYMGGIFGALAPQSTFPPPGLLGSLLKKDK
jgi:RNase P subunit RPR2